MSPEEWESLCDRCAQCCVHKFQDDDTGTVYYTNILCEHLDPETHTCTVYETRRETVPECACLDQRVIEELSWLPVTCAYRLLAEGRDLPAWHPLITGDPDSVSAAGMCLSEGIPEDEAEHRESEIIFREAETGRRSDLLFGAKDLALGI